MFQAFRNIKIGVFIAFVNLLIQGISFFVQNFIARNLGTASYGHFGLLQTDYSIFCAIADFGMTTLILAFFGSRATVGSLFRNILQLRLFAAMGAALLMIAFACIFRHDHPIFYGELIFTLGLVFQHAFFDWYFICGKFWKRLFVSKLLHTISYSTVMGITLLYFKVDRIELIALAMVLAALPAFFYGVTQAFNAKLLKITRRTFRFIAIMIKAGTPYAISSFASFAYLPLGLYVADKFASNEFLGCYNFGHKILLLCSSIMVHFISSNLITLHSTHDKDIPIVDPADSFLCRELDRSYTTDKRSHSANSLLLADIPGHPHNAHLDAPQGTRHPYLRPHDKRRRHRKHHRLRTCRDVPRK